MKYLILFVFILFLPLFSLAGGHSEIRGTGTAKTIDTQVMEGKSGVLVKSTTSDVWIWENLPEGFPTATSAQCTQFLAIASGQEQPISFSFTCLSVDPDGDITMSIGAPHESGRALITQVVGTGKWEAFNGIQFIGGTDTQIDDSTSVYSWKAIKRVRF